MEGLAQTCNFSRPGAPPLAKMLRSSNAMEPMIKNYRHHSANVKRPRDGQMAFSGAPPARFDAKHSSAESTAFCASTLRTALEQRVVAGVTPVAAVRTRR